MRLRLSLLIALTSAAPLAGCYTTSVYTNQPGDGVEHRDRQWFALWGAEPMSQPAGEECDHGLSYAESRVSAGDVGITMGLGIAGGIVAAAACSGVDDREAYVSCIGAGPAIGSFFAPRTVRYECAEDVTAFINRERAEQHAASERSELDSARLGE